MGHKQISRVLRQMKQVFSGEELRRLGMESGQCRRFRKVTPQRLALSLIQSLGEGKVETLADLQREFNRMHGLNVRYKPFHKQLSKESFPEFMRSLCARLMSKLSGQVLNFSPDSPFSRFSHIILHDGSSFALKSSLRDAFPGRFSETSPAAVELHVSMELLSERPQSVTLTPDTDAEVKHLPEASSIAGGLLLADRMFFIKRYLADIARQGGHYVVKTKGTLNPVIRCATRADGGEIRSWRGKRLKEVSGSLRRYRRIDLEVCWEERDYTLDARLVVTWNRKENRPRYLVTNLPRTEFSLEQVCDAYRLRWQVELLFKEWKSYANLHAFDTKNAAIAEGLIWASICAALLKRFLAHAAQRLFQVAISTRTAAMCLRSSLTRILDALAHNRRGLRSCIHDVLAFLAENARRSHPKRERLKGRAKLGLEPVFGDA